MLSDPELLRRYAEENSEEAFAELVQRHVDLVYSAAVRQLGGDTHRAEDVVQRVFCDLARKARSLTGHPALTGWLYMATRYATAQVRRAEARRSKSEKEAQLMQEILGSESGATDWAQVRPVLDVAMGELGERDREAVLLRYFARRSFAEIGALAGVSEDAARMRVDRALDKLHAALARRGVKSTGGAVAAVLATQAVVAAPAGLAVEVASAAVAGSAAGAIDVLAFMSTTKFAGVSAAALVLLVVGTAVQQVRGEREAEAELAVERREHAAQVARRREAEQRVGTAQRELAELQQRVEEARRSAGAAEAKVTAGGRDGGVATADPVAAGKELLARFPEVKRALRERSLARIRARYEPFYAELRLTPEQVERFEALLLDGDGITVTQRGMGTFNLQAGAGRSRAEVEAGLRALLGAEGYQRFRETTEQSGRQQFAVELASVLYFTEEPLTAQQARELGAVAALHPIRPRGNVMTRDWDELLAAARPILSDGQIAALSRMRVQEEFGATMKARMFSENP